MRVERIDRIPIRLDGKVERDSRGFARVWGKVVHANALLTYGRADGHDTDEHVEFVPEETVNDPDAIDSLRFAPITMPHPPEMLDARNTSRHQIGTVIDVKFEDGQLMALHQFTDATALDRIDGGTFELSPGYTAELDETPGEFEGQRYAAVQRGRVYNHQAVVDQARAGPDNKLFIDSKRAASGLRIQVHNDEGEPTMAMVTIGDSEFEVPDAVAEHIEQLQAKSDQEGEEEKEEDSKDAGEEEEMDAEEDGTTPSTETSGTPEALSATVSVSSSKSATDGLKAIMNQLGGISDRVAKLDKAADDKAAAEKAREDAESTYKEAKVALPKNYKWDGKSAAKIMRDAIVARNPDLKSKADGAMKRPDRLRGMFDSEMARSPRADSHPLGEAMPDGEPKKDVWQLRVDAARAASTKFRVLGNEAMRHESVQSVGA